MSRKNILSALMIAGVLTGGVGLASHANVNKQVNTNKVSNVRLMTNRVSSFGCVKNGNGNLVVTNANGKTVGYVTVGQMLRLGSSNGSTTKVTVEETGVTGYISNSNIDYIKSGVNDSLTRMNRRGMVINVSTEVHVRANATMDSSILAEMTNNTNLTITGKQGDWYRVSVNGIKGFVFGAYIGEGNSISGGTVTIPEGVHYGSSSKGNRVVVNSQIINQANNGTSSNISNNVPVVENNNNNNTPVVVNNNNGSHITNNGNHITPVANNNNNTPVVNNNNNNNNNAKHEVPVNHTNNNNGKHEVPVNHTNNDNHTTPVVNNNNNNGKHETPVVKNNNNNSKHETPVKNNHTDKKGENKEHKNTPSVKEMFNAYVANCNKVFLNESPANNSKHLETLSEGAKVEVIGSQGNWLKVKSGNLVGYIYKTYLSTTKPKAVEKHEPKDIHTTPHSQRKEVIRKDTHNEPVKPNKEEHHDNVAPHKEQQNNEQHHDKVTPHHDNVTPNHEQPNKEKHHDNVTPHKEQHKEQPNNEQHHDNVTPNNEQHHEQPNKEQHHEQPNKEQHKEVVPHHEQQNNREHHEQQNNGQSINHNDNNHQPVVHHEQPHHDQPVVHHEQPNNNQPVNHEHQNNPSRPQPQQQVGPVYNAEESAQALQEINEWRSMFNQGSITMGGAAQQYAEQSAKQQILNNDFSDNTTGDWLSDTAWAGTTGQEGFKLAMDAFKESPAHFNNLVYNIDKGAQVGIAVYTYHGGTYIKVISSINENNAGNQMTNKNNSIPGLGI